MTYRTADEMRFPIGTIVILATDSGVAEPAALRPGDDLTLESPTRGSAHCRIRAITPEMIEVENTRARYRLTPAAATLTQGGTSTYEGGWVVRSAVGL
ncbi:hypothetical protein LMIY3S_04774 [Labrys miyagiensis]